MEREEKAGRAAGSREGEGTDAMESFRRQIQRETCRTRTFHPFCSEGWIICHLLRVKK